MLSMKLYLRIVLTTLLCLLAGVVHATFEIADPAADIYREQAETADQGEPAEEEAGMKPRGFGWGSSDEGSGTLCSIDGDNGECWCIDKKSARRLEMSQAQCKQRIVELSVR